MMFRNEYVLLLYFEKFTFLKELWSIEIFDFFSSKTVFENEERTHVQNRFGKFHVYEKLQIVIKLSRLKMADSRWS